jgi:Flp pilus assembly protein TadG
MAVVMNLVLVPLMLGVWEVGRLVHVQQVVVNATREGARLAAQGLTIGSTGAYTKVVVAYKPTDNALATARLPNVKATVHQSLHGAGLSTVDWDDLTVRFEWLDQPNTTDENGATVAAPQGPGTPATVSLLEAGDQAPPVAPADPLSTTAQPFRGVKDQRFRLTTSVPFSKVRWVNLGIVNPTTVGFAVEWRMMVDETFRIDTNIPSVVPNL